MNHFEFKIEKSAIGYKIVGGVYSEYSPTNWVNLQMDFKTREELLDYIVMKADNIISKLNKQP